MMTSKIMYSFENEFASLLKTNKLSKDFYHNIELLAKNQLRRKGIAPSFVLPEIQGENSIGKAYADVAVSFYIEFLNDKNKIAVLLVQHRKGQMITPLIKKMFSDWITDKLRQRGGLAAVLGKNMKSKVCTLADANKLKTRGNGREFRNVNSQDTSEQVAPEQLMQVIKEFPPLSRLRIHDSTEKNVIPFHPKSISDLIVNIANKISGWIDVYKLAHALLNESGLGEEKMISYDGSQYLSDNNNCDSHLHIENLVTKFYGSGLTSQYFEICIKEVIEKELTERQVRILDFILNDIAKEQIISILKISKSTLYEEFTCISESLQGCV